MRTACNELRNVSNDLLPIKADYVNYLCNEEHDEDRGQEYIATTSSEVLEVR